MIIWSIFGFENDRSTLEHDALTQWRASLKMLKKHSKNQVFVRFAFIRARRVSAKNAIDNAMRSGSDFFLIWTRFWTPWRPNWSLLGSLGRVLASLGRLLGCSWAPLGRSWGALGRSWGALGRLLGRSWGDLERSLPLLAVCGGSGLHFQASEDRF